MPRLRLDLDLLPSPDPARPGLMIRDPFGYSSRVLLLPPLLAQSLQFFDGEQSELDLRHFLVQATGNLSAGAAADQLIGALDEAGFLDNERFAALRQESHRAFAEAPVRVASHIGPGGYPGDPAEMRTVFDGYFQGTHPEPDPASIAIAAPHVSPFGGWESYAAAYAAIPAAASDRVFVVLGTSHYGQPERFGLTRKPFETPYGQTTPALDLVDRLEKAAPSAVLMEDFCHAREHSIEFQIAFLQHRFGPSIPVMPVLCGPFAQSVYRGGRPEANEGVARFLDALAEMQHREGKRLFWVMGVDFAHIGSRYGDSEAAQPGEGLMTEVGARDRLRMEAIGRGAREEYWEDVQKGSDPLRWCGSAPLYTFMSAVRDAVGETHRYEQWAIDHESVVTFGAMSFALKA
jgi:AmmeMemoRadiSam system protein B